MNYDLIPAYTMKCRLYVNKTQRELIDKAIAGVRVYYNCALWEMRNNYTCTIERPKKDKDGNVLDGTVHFPDLKKAQSAEWKRKLAKEHPIIECVPAGALMGKNSCIGRDMAQSLGKMTVERINSNIAYKKAILADQKLSKKEKKEKLKGVQTPEYYSERHPRTSYTYQEPCSKIETSGNPNVLYITLNKIGRCKIRGWNRQIRFDEAGTVNFVEYCKQDKKKRLTVTVSVDNCGDHWICFKLLNVYKPMEKGNGQAVGVDVGIKDIAILSDGTKYENKKFKRLVKRKKRLLNRKMSRRQGWANEEFREAHKKNPELEVSKGYEKAKLAHAKLERKTMRQRSYRNHKITREIVEQHDAVAVESLNIKGMFRNKHLAYALSDAAMGEILSELKYKADWHGREIREIGRWTPSSKRCSNCGAIKKDLKLSDREWTCRACRKHHDRDINAAINILYYAYNAELETAA